MSSVELSVREVDSSAEGSVCVEVSVASSCERSSLRASRTWSVSLASYLRKRENVHSFLRVSRTSAMITVMHDGLLSKP